MTTVWRIVARLRGWQEAWDYDDDVLVVWHDKLGVHYSGDGAWKCAALHRRAA